MEDNKLTTQTNTGFNIVTDKQMWDYMKEVAKTFIESRAMPSYLQNASQVIVVLQAGREMGFQFFESIKYLYMVNGSTQITGQGAIRRIKEAGYEIEYEDKDDECTVRVLDYRNEIPGHGKGPSTVTAEETVNFKDAEDSGYTKDSKGEIKTGWRKGMNRKLKLRYLAVSTIVKSKMPEVLGSAVDIVEVAEDYPRVEKQVAQVVNEEPQITAKEFISKKRKEKKEADNAEIVEAALEVEEGEVVEAPEDPQLISVRKEFFAVANDLEWDPEDAKREIKTYFGDKKSFNDLTYLELLSYVRGMRLRLKQKQQEGK
jgi:hypothetical protein